MSIPPEQSETETSRTTGGQPAPRQTNLLPRIVAGFSTVLALAILFLFLPAGDWNYWQAWVLLAVVFLPTASLYAYFYKTDPQLIERRLRQKEERREQKLLMRWGKLLFGAIFTLPGFDHRLGWSSAWLGTEPLWLILLSDAMIVAAFLFVGWVVVVNRFAGRTIRIEEGQTVISSGPYRCVRHPMYAGSLILWVFSPLALGSYVALPAFALLLPFYVLRVLNEEKLLRAELPGYPEYCQRTRYRLIPFVW